MGWQWTWNYEIRVHVDNIDELVQERRNSIANALELRLSCTNWTICFQVEGEALIILLWITNWATIPNVLKSQMPHVFNENLMLNVIGQWKDPMDQIGHRG